MGSKPAANAVPPDVLWKYKQDSDAAAVQLTEAMEELRAAETVELEAVGKSGLQINLEIDLVGLDVRNAGKCVAEAEKWVCDLR